MRNIYLLTSNFTQPGLSCINSFTGGFNEYRLYNGELIQDWPENIKFEFEGEPLADFLTGGLHWRLVSENVRQIFIREEIPGVQFLPVQVVHVTSGRTIGPYWALNIMFDETQSNDDFSSNWYIFRRRASIYISERLKRILEYEGVTTGAGFEKMPS